MSIADAESAFRNRVEPGRMLFFVEAPTLGVPELQMILHPYEHDPVA
jgi:hypothetical protein